MLDSSVALLRLQMPRGRRPLAKYIRVSGEGHKHENFKNKKEKPQEIPKCAWVENQELDGPWCSFDLQDESKNDDVGKPIGQWFPNLSAPWNHLELLIIPAPVSHTPHL